jgi:hypothetical protein
VHILELIRIAYIIPVKNSRRTGMHDTPSSSRAEAMFAFIREYLDGPATTQREFCSAHNIAYSTFQLYLSKYRRNNANEASDASGRFLPITISGRTIDHDHPECEIQWPDGVVVRFATRPDPAYLATLLQAGAARL